MEKNQGIVSIQTAAYADNEKIDLSMNLQSTISVKADKSK